MSEPSAPTVPMAATILAAGLGRRLGHRPKTALQMGGVSLLERLIGALRQAGLQQVSVVIGPYAETLQPIADRCGAEALHHGRSDPSLVDSQRLALQAHLDARGGHDLMIVLADLPWLEDAHIRTQRQAWASRATHIHAQMPTVDGVRGHPLVMSSHAARQVLATPAHLGIRDWLARHPEWIQPVTSDQPAHVRDLDTPSDLATLQQDCHPQAVSWPAPWDGDQRSPNPMASWR